MLKKYKEFEKTFYDEILKWFKETHVRDKIVYSRFNVLAKEHGPVVFQVLFDIIANLKIEPEESRKLWDQTWLFKSKLEERLKNKIDFRVALLEYLLETNQKLKNPKIIELSLFEKTQNSLVVDELTGLYNFRFLENQLRYEVAKSLRFNTEFSIIFIDIDNFKIVNDIYGHELGNTVLKKIAKILIKNIRTTDIAFRFGGDEFVVFLQNTRKRDSFTVAESLRKSVETELTIPQNKSIHITISAGIASFPADADSQNALMKNADQALLFSKQNGKNCINFFSSLLRGHKRIHLKKKIYVGAFSCNVCPLPLVDLSKTGISFKTKTAYETGSYCQVFFKKNSSESFLIKIIRVIENKGDYLIGGMFIDMNEGKCQLLKKYLSFNSN